MATDTATAQDQGISNFATGSSTGAAAAIAVTLGFKPRHVRVLNETDQLIWEKFQAQVDANCLKIAANGTVTTDTGSAIVLMGDDGDSYKGFSLSAGLAASGKTLHWYAIG